MNFELLSNSLTLECQTHNLTSRGTGVHPTTRLCLEFLEKNVNDGDVLLVRVLDYASLSCTLCYTPLRTDYY